MNQLIPRIEFILQSFFQKQLTCPHCASKSLNTVAKKYRILEIKNCNQCGIFFTSPIYKPLVVSELYDKLYKAEGSTTEMPTDEQLSKLTNQRFQGSDKYFGDRIQFIASFVKGRNLLEIGSSWGYFLWQAKTLGYQSTGIELSDSRREFAKEKLGVNVLKSISNLGGEKFDVIYTAHTLEHFTDLSTIFSELYDHLEAGGKLIIEVPNFDFFNRGNSLLSMIGAVHPIGFSSKFFADNLPKYGFKSIRFYDSWADFPNASTSKSSTNIVLLLAEK